MFVVICSAAPCVAEWLCVFSWVQLVHRQEMARYGNAKTVAELQSMLTALQKVMDVNANHARKAAVRARCEAGGSQLLKPTGPLMRLQPTVASLLQLGLGVTEGVVNLVSTYISVLLLLMPWALCWRSSLCVSHP
jgi:hypothetical protein